SAYRSAVPLSKPMVGGCGPTRIIHGVPPSALRFQSSTERKFSALKRQFILPMRRFRHQQPSRNTYEPPHLAVIARLRSRHAGRSTLMNAAVQAGGEQTAIRPFHVNFPEAELTELRRRINSTRWPDRET